MYFLLSDGDPVISCISCGEKSTELKIPVKYCMLFATLFILAFLIDVFSKSSFFIICSSMLNLSSLVSISAFMEQNFFPYCIKSLSYFDILDFPTERM